MFTIGTDEHGLKIQKIAKEQDMTPQKLCDQNAFEFKKLFDEAQVDYSVFIRTSKFRHKLAVAEFWTKIKHDIDVGIHEGFYSTNEESFVPQKDLVEKNGSFYTKLGELCEKVSEQNYIFKVKDKEAILKWAETAVLPKFLAKKCQSDIETQHSEISVSRPSSRLSWGIQVPNDDSQTIYVWLDALTNYLTVLDYGTELFNESNISKCTHIIGKDIMKFHYVYYPHFLKSAGLPLPEHVIAHGHWLKDSVKMSKSIGNVVCPFELLKKFGVDAVRTYMLAFGPQGRDCDFNLKALEKVHNEFLVSQYLNMLRRVTTAKFFELMPEEGIRFTHNPFGDA